MILFGRKHLQVSESNQIVDSLFKIMRLVTSGSEIRSDEPINYED